VGSKENVLDCVWRISCWAQKYSTTPSPPTSKSEQLRTLLRKYPTWRLGHLELGEESLAADDIATAYASAHALLLLESSSSQPSCASPYSSRASFLLGRCYLRRGDAKRALQFFTQVSTQISIRDSKDRSLVWRIKEESAAAYMVCGDSNSALSTLLTVPEEKLTAEGAAAKAYLRKQLDGSLSSDPYTAGPQDHAD
jgi:lipopolysaccharide biosynthesis regulator YciM